MSRFPHLSQKFFVVELVGQDRKKSLSFFTLQCHQNLGDVEKAKEWLKKSLELPAKDYDVSLSLYFCVELWHGSIKYNSSTAVEKGIALGEKDLVDLL